MLDAGSDAAAEGTAAHALGEHKLKTALNLTTDPPPMSPYHNQEMDEHTDDYRDYVLEQLSLQHNARIFLETKVDYGRYVKEGYGTCDCLLVADGCLTVVDFKYGMVWVDAASNTQLWLYAIGAIEYFEGLYDVDTVTMTIFQPRRHNVSTTTISKAELMNWAEETLKPAAALAWEGKGDYCSGEWCKYCRAAVRCRERAEANIRLARYDFQSPPLLTDDEIADILSKADSLESWVKDVKAYALEAAVHHNKAWPGFTLAEGQSKRRYTDEAAVAAALTGINGIYEQNLISITKMEKLLGRKRFEELISPFVVKPPGKPTLKATTDYSNDYLED